MTWRRRGDEPHRPADHRAGRSRRSAASPSSRCTCSSTRRSSAGSAPPSSAGWPSPRPCSASSSPACNFLTYGTTERVARRLGAGRPADAADVGVQTMWLSTIVGVVVAPLVVSAAPLAGRRARRRRRRLRLRRDVPADRRRSACPFVVFALGAQGVQRGATDYRTPLVILLTANLVNAVLEVRVRVRLRLGRAGLGVVDGDRPGRRRRGVRRRRAPPPRARPRQRRPSRAGMAPLLTAGRHLLLRVGSMLAVTSGATAIAARIDDADAGRPPDRRQPAAVPRPRPRRAGHPGPDARRRGARPGSAWRRPPSCRRRCVRLSIVVGAGARRRAGRRSRRSSPTSSAPTPPCVDRATAVVLWLAALLVPAAIAFAYDGVLIGAGDYRFLGLAALGLPRRRRPDRRARARHRTPASPASGPASACG